MSNSKSNTTVKKAKSTLSKVNNEHKLATRSMSAISKYIISEGENEKSQVSKLIAEINAKNKTKLTAKYCTPRNLCKFAKENELFTNIAPKVEKGEKRDFVKGDKKMLFSIYVVLGRFFNRACKAKA